MGKAENLANLLAGTSELRRSVAAGNLHGFLDTKKVLVESAIVEVFSVNLDLVARNYVQRRNIELFFTSGDDDLVRKAIDFSVSSDFFVTPDGLAVKCTAPIIDDSTLEILGALVVTYPVDVSLLQSIKEQVKAEVTLQWSEDGRVVSTFQGPLGDSLTRAWRPEPLRFEAIARWNEESEVHERILEKPYALSYGLVTDTHSRPVGILSVALDRTSVEQYQQDALEIVLVSALALSILGIAIGLLTAFFLTRPIYRLLHATRQLAEGRFDKRFG